MRRLSSRSVTAGAVTAVSALVLASCASPSEPTWRQADPAPQGYTPSEQVVEDYDEWLEEEEDDVVAHCVRRSSKDDGTYLVVRDKLCDGTGKHHAYLWYYGGKRVKNLVSKGSTTRPRHVTVVTRDGDEIGRGGKISRDGFGNRTTVGS